MSGSLSERTTSAIRNVLDGHVRGWRAIAPFAGPAVVASVAYIDPGNFATNIQAGARYGYGLLWVVLLANAVAMLFQSMSARLGIVTNRNLAELCRDHFPRPVVLTMWAVSELAAMATDLAEFLGGAIGLSLLLHLPLLLGMGLVAVLTYIILLLDRRGFRPLELVIGAMVGVIGACYVIELCVAPPDWRAAGMGLVMPRLADHGALLLAVGIVGATVMPHAIYLHSGLTQDRAPARSMAERRRLARYSNREVVAALILAGAVNIAMVIMAARAFHAGHPGVAEIGEAYHTLVPLFGAAAAGVFLVSLLGRGRRHAQPGPKPGRALAGAAGADGGVAAAQPPARRDGRDGDRAGDHGAGLDGDGSDGGAEPGAARQHAGTVRLAVGVVERNGDAHFRRRQDRVRANQHVVRPIRCAAQDGHVRFVLGSDAAVIAPPPPRP